MRISFILLFLLLTILVQGQDSPKSPQFHINSVAPDIKVKKWLKGNPVNRFEKGNLYVLEFWATWCKPCIEFMPHLSKLSKKYKDKVTFMGVSIYEEPKTTFEEIKHFVDNMGVKMNYNVAIDSNEYMAKNWMEGSMSRGIPKLFVINSDGLIAWIGHPNAVDSVLQKIIDNEWNLDEEYRKTKELAYIDSVSKAFSYSILDYQFIDTPDSLLKEVNRRVLIEPKLQNTHFVVHYIFNSLLQLNQNKAHSYGNKILDLGNESLYRVIVESVLYNKTIKINPKIYLLAAEAYSLDLKYDGSYQYDDMSQDYRTIADWYWRGKDREKAILAQKNAIDSKQKFENREVEKLKETLEHFLN
ncbi:MAG: TlpA family protein disulfide reductase [Sphingobacterium sp.]